MARQAPKVRRQHKAIYTLDSGLDYSKPSTMIAESNTPNCQNVWMRDGRFGKVKGSLYFGSTDSSPLSGIVMLAKHYIKNDETDKLIVHTTEDIYVYDPVSQTLSSILGAGSATGDEDNPYAAVVQNDFYVFSNGVDVLQYWDMNAASISTLAGGVACRGLEIIGERVNAYGIVDYPRRVAWTIVGGLTVPTPLDTDWSNAGSGDTDLDGVFGDDVIMCTAKLGNYVVIYGKKTIVMQEYAGTTPDTPYNFYTRVAGVGTPSSRGVANLGDSHIILGWDDIYLYQGGTSVTPLGSNIKSELYNLINPEYINRCFMVYLNQSHEVKIFYPSVGSTSPDSYMIYNLDSKSWSKGARSYTGTGSYINIDADTWATIGDGTLTWDTVPGRWNDVTRESLYPIILYGDSAGIIYRDDASTYDLVGVAIDAYWESKDLIADVGYKRVVTNWMSFSFEALGSTIDVSYSTDSGLTWSTPIQVTLTNTWEEYSIDINVNSPQIRFKLGNSSLGGYFEVRQIEPGYIVASDRGI